MQTESSSDGEATPQSCPHVEYFGLKNKVFTMSDTEAPVGVEHQSAKPWFAPVRQRKRMGILAVSLLLLISALAYHGINRNRMSRLELAAEQIVIGSDWGEVWTGNKDVWEDPMISWTSNGTTEEFAYGGLSHTVRSKAYLSLTRAKFGFLTSGGLLPIDQFPVVISVDQNGNGNVVGVQLRGVWRRATTLPVVSSPTPE